MMNEHRLSQSQVALRPVIRALFDLRDALLELSLALKDWQFEADHERRAAAARQVRQVLTKAAERPPGNEPQTRYGCGDK